MNGIFTGKKGKNKIYLKKQRFLSKVLDKSGMMW